MRDISAWLPVGAIEVFDYKLDRFAKSHPRYLVKALSLRLCNLTINDQEGFRYVAHLVYPLRDCRNAYAGGDFISLLDNVPSCNDREIGCMISLGLKNAKEGSELFRKPLIDMKADVRMEAHKYLPSFIRAFATDWYEHKYAQVPI